jgi:hypothetical protein
LQVQFQPDREFLFGARMHANPTPSRPQMPYKVHLLKVHPSITVHNDYTWIVTGCEEAALHAWASKTENAVIAHICSGKRVKLSWQLVVWANSDPVTVCTLLNVLLDT